jgi:hypothetical protein
MSVVMIGPFPIPQVVGGLIGAVGGYAVAYRIFSPRKLGISWFANQLRTLGELTIMAVGMMLGQIVGHLLHRFIA